MKSEVFNLDGVAVDVNAIAAATGFRVPVTLTDAVWQDCVAWDANKEACAGQSSAGRLWDVLSVAYAAHQQAMTQGAVRWEFDVLRVPRGGDEAEPVRLIWNLTQYGGEDMVVITDSFDN